MLKRLFDITIAIVELALFLPIFAVVGFMIKLDDGGPVFYQGLRVGRYGVPFRMLKFRTMVVKADKLGGPSTADDDPRITRIGKVLRKYKIDELPQLISVLIGDMSFVGPRPEVPQYVALYSAEEQAILTVQPGITDWATLWNSDEGALLAGSSDPERTYLEKIRPAKIRLQLEYVRRRSFWVDLSILIKTVGSIILRKKPQALMSLK